MNLNATIRELQKIFSTVFGQRFVLHTRLDPALNLIHGDAREVESILVNLFMQAHEVIPAQEVMVSTANLEVDDEAAAELSLTPGKYVRLDLLLSGWIDIENVRQAVRKLRGALTTKATPERGVTITLAFPQAP